MDSFEHDETFLQEISQFNKGLYFEAHDTWEALWLDARGNNRRFLHALIRIALGYYHHAVGKYRGAVSQLTRGSGTLRHYPSLFASVDVAGLRKNAKKHAVICEKLACGGVAGREEEWTPIIHLV